MKRWFAFALIVAFPAAAGAQAISCNVPSRIPVTSAPGGAPRLLPVGGYTLALSWSPEYCRFRQQNSDDRLQCGSPKNRFGFILHGLWPEGRGDLWPQYCRRAPLVPEPVLRQTLCVMPSAALQQHEWAKHGVCAFRTPEAYFRAARGLYAAIRYPDMDALSRNPNLRVASFATAFAARNPALRPDMMRVGIDRKGWLEEVVLCLDIRFRPTACRRDRADRDRRPLKVWRAER